MTIFKHNTESGIFKIYQNRRQYRGRYTFVNLFTKEEFTSQNIPHVKSIRRLKFEDFTPIAVR